MSIMLVDCNLPRYCTRSGDDDDDDDDLYDSYVNHQTLVIHTAMY